MPTAIRSTRTGCATHCNQQRNTLHVTLGIFRSPLSPMTAEGVRASDSV